MTIKPCPFCGGRAVPRPWIGHNGYATVSGPHFVRCEGCKTATRLFNTHDGALAAWNHRVDPREDAMRKFLEMDGA